MAGKRVTKWDLEPFVVEDRRAALRVDHAGKWIAWSLDEKDIIAVAETAEGVRVAAQRAGHVEFIYDMGPARPCAADHQSRMKFAYQGYPVPSIGKAHQAPIVGNASSTSVQMTTSRHF